MAFNHLHTRTETIVKRFEYLSDKISKYAHRWNRDGQGQTSARLEGWVDEYNEMRSRQYSAFMTYCERRGLSVEHDAYDCLA
jgi:hypothetical protein